MSLLVPIIVAAIIALQIFFFVKNVLRMRDYKKIFAEENSWGIAHNPETNFVSGIYGRGNNVFESIKESINTTPIEELSEDVLHHNTEKVNMKAEQPKNERTVAMLSKALQTSHIDNQLKLET